jgi:hypothetical protein
MPEPTLFPAQIPLTEAENVPKPPSERHAGGRPKIWTLARSRELLEDLEAWLHTDEANEGQDIRARLHLTVEIYMVSKGLSINLLHELPKKYPELAGAVQRMKRFQAAKIADLALRGVLNPRFSQFFMSAQHGWAMTQNNNQTHSGSVALQHSGVTINFTEHKPEVKDAQKS